MLAVAANLGESIALEDGKKAVTVPLRRAWRGYKPLLRSRQRRRAKIPKRRA
jgi:hypothetical protein